MHRPSLYKAFGSKEELFTRTLEHYQQMVHEAILRAARPSGDFVASLGEAFENIIETFTLTGGGIRGGYT